MHLYSCFYYINNFSNQSYYNLARGISTVNILKFMQMYKRETYGSVILITEYRNEEVSKGN